LCDFLSSGDTFLNSDDIDWLSTQVQEPIEKTGQNGQIWVWEHPQPDTKYVISADIARGDAADFSVFHVLNADTSEVVVEYMGKSPPEVMGKLMNDWGRRYNDALAIPENNSFGYTTCITLRDDYLYPRLYYDNNKGDPFKFSQPDTGRLPGFSTQHKSRVNILTKLEELLRNKLIHTKSVRLVQQLRAFVWEGSKPQALKGSHDDLILSLAIGAWFVGGAYKLDEKKAALTRALGAATVVRSTSTSELPGEIDEVRPLVNPNISGLNAHNNPHKPSDPEHVQKKLKPSDRRHRDISDFSWLL
jgi:hypothetical protein